MSPRRGAEHPRWAGDIPGYHAAHGRIRRAKGGPASDHPCIECDGQAEHWAYTHDDPDELLDPYLRLYYSLKVDHYVPLCARDHKALDRDHRLKSRQVLHEHPTEPVSTWGDTPRAGTCDPAGKPQSPLHSRPQALENASDLHKRSSGGDLP